MRKRIIALILLSVFLITTASCTSHNETNITDNNTESETDRQKTLENPIVLKDKLGTKLGEIDNRANFTAVEGGIFYSIFTLKENSYTGKAEYRFFSLKDKTDVFLGKFEDQGYEASFARTSTTIPKSSLRTRSTRCSRSPIICRNRSGNRPHQ